MIDRLLTADSARARCLRGLLISLPTVALFAAAAILEPGLLAR